MGSSILIAWVLEQQFEPNVEWCLFGSHSTAVGRPLKYLTSFALLLISLETVSKIKKETSLMDSSVLSSSTEWSSSNWMFHLCVCQVMRHEGDS